MDLIYLDNNATTRPDPRVVEAMLAYLQDHYANPSSLYMAAQQVRHALEESRERVAALIGAKPRRIVFTSGGTESVDLAIRGALATVPSKRHIITSAVEHDCVLNLCRRLEAEGYEVTYVPVGSGGAVAPASVAAAIRDDTALVSIMHANNETGVIMPIEAVGAIARERGLLVHVDAAQTVGKIPVDVASLPVDLLSFAAHKFHGPKGVGGLYVRRGRRIRPQLVGGHQERDLRAGTENVPGGIGMGVAATLAAEHLDEENTRVRAMRDRLEAGILERVPYARPIGDRACRLPNTTSIAFASLEAEAVLMVLSNAGICASSGSACSSGSLDPSHVLVAMGLDPALVHGAIRFSLSRMNTEPEIERTLDLLPGLLERLRPLSERTRMDRS
jgi:cysteine desulfurase